MEITPEQQPLLRNPNFRWMTCGNIISNLGDQFTLIALPWLVLKMSTDPLQLGLVIAIMSIPRALFILIGGALVDHYSPKRVLMLTKYINVLLLGVLSALVLTNHLTMPLVYLLALGIGLASAFSIPSGSSLLPNVIPSSQLDAANSIQMSVRQLAMLLGPVLAGLLIAGAGNHPSAGAISDALGLGLAFALNCLSFALSAWTLHQVDVQFSPKTSARQPIFRAVGEGLQMVWRDQMLRTMFLYWGVITFVVGGITQVGLPLLANSQLHSAAALGLLLGAHGTGTLLGMLGSTQGRKLRVGTLGRTLLLIDGVIGIIFMPLGLIHTAWQGIALLLPMGLLAGLMQITVITWIQRRVPAAMLGRTMSIMMFVFIGTPSLGASVFGALMQYLPLADLFAAGGLILISLALLAFAATPLRKLADI